MARLSYINSILKNPKHVADDIHGVAMSSDNGGYLMEISIGTPPVKQLAFADTGSDLIWTQCSPCHKCFKQESPIFDPKKSSTFKVLSVSKCTYNTSYGDTSYSNGELASETITVGKTSLHKIAYGCGHNNQFTAFSKMSAGIVGLGGGSLSLVGQISNSIDNMFSHCLAFHDFSKPPDKNLTSKISFGKHAVVSGPGVVKIPLVPQYPATFYYIKLISLRVGDTEISASSFFFKDGVNLIVDSGTTLTLLPNHVYYKLEAAVKRQTPDKQVKNSEYKVCYKNRKNFKAPRMTAHFSGGVDLEMAQNATFFAANKDVICLGFVPGGFTGIWGNLLQMDYLIGFDLLNGEVSFKRTDCGLYQGPS
ncbi:aspartic proteinase CDR1-like [Impatiens glandulifera]|uniref:aspartic proteinase CDR1-like n=1 Tax=Impatiens glandulifera TaxID=253017 RepID=UPI001FB06992|nr:aspartic proteinase CDR1-like [Impatiens glandulifera]